MPDLNSIHSRLSANPLSSPKEIEKFYIDLFESRGDNPIKSLKRKLINDASGELQILFSGYRGCGKSTELNKLKTEIQNEFMVLNFSVLQELDPFNINYIELITLTMEKLFKEADEQKISVRKALLESINAWLNTEEIEKIRTYGGSVEAEAGAEVGLTASFFAKFFASIRTATNASYSAKRTVTEVVERRLSDLIKHCNDLITEIKLQLHRINKKGLIIIIEDLDKLSLDKSEELFFNHSNVLTRLKAHAIFTFPISLRHHPQATLIKNNFEEDFELPMVKVKTKDGQPFQQGRDDLFNLILRRIEPDNFENNALLYQFIDMSGGCIRDLFRLIRNAADNALNQEREIIKQQDYDKAFKKLKRDYENTIAEKRVGDKIVTPVKDYYDALVAIAKSDTKKAQGTQVELDLRQNLCILGYNDEGWCDVHPVVREILKERGLIK